MDFYENFSDDENIEKYEIIAKNGKNVYKTKCLSKPLNIYFLNTKSSNKDTKIESELKIKKTQFTTYEEQTMNYDKKDNSAKMINSISDNSISYNSISDNSISYNSISYNSISDNSISDNSISDNSISDNSISDRHRTTKTNSGCTKEIIKKNIDYKNIIIQIMGNSVVSTIDMLPGLIYDSHGPVFNYKTADCNRGNHLHKTLISFLGCCSSFIKILNLKKAFVKRNDQAAFEISKKRFNVHFINSKKEYFLSHLEMMILNIFPAKTTMCIDDFKVIFKEVYNVEIEYVCRENGYNHDIVDIIFKMQSDNIFVTVSGKSFNVTCIPTNDPAYIMQKFKGYYKAKKDEEYIFK
ncbi:hypothetical protein DMUE_0962 [Dictyocoela muelleri]|nr:hypothetical protein DMUE_0962 [Dictyocoela muelleri]